MVVLINLVVLRCAHPRKLYLSYQLTEYTIVLGNVLAVVDQVGGSALRSRSFTERLEKQTIHQYVA